jgi:hypothetical protein
MVIMLDRSVYRITRTVKGEQVKEEPNPAEKLLKYFPDAALALYITLDPLFRQAVSGDALKFWLWFSLVLSAVFCWLYLGKFWKVHAKRQRAFSAGALVLYVAALGGPFSTLTGYKTIYGTIAAVIATAFLIFVPSEDLPSPPPA